MRRLLLSILIGLSANPIMAQQSLSVTPTIGVSNTATGKFYYANQDEPPRAVEFEAGTVAPSYFLTNINRHFNIPAEFTFVEAESNTDNLGMRHRLLQQYYNGIPLEGMGYRVHEKNGFVTSANGRAIRNIKLNVQTGISEEMAFQMAINHLHSKDSVFRRGKKLIVSKGFTFAPESFSIAFQFDIDVSLIERWRISIDAGDGQVLNKVSLVNNCHKKLEPPLPYDTGTGLTDYYGTKTVRVEKFANGSSRLLGQTENGGIIGTYDFGNRPVILLRFGGSGSEFTSSNTTFNDTRHKSGVSVQWAAEQAYEYYFKKFNRKSFDNKGSTITSYVHVDQGLNNAFWTGRLLAFGDGSNNNPLVELDVVAHELTHGVTQYEAALQYSNEPGALNESFSDIFGKAVEFDTFGDTATWQLSKHYRDGGLRDFSNPNLKDQPDTYAGDMWYTGYGDYGGVHYNSGVQNFWFYLLCEGGTGVNDHQTSYSINAIGMDAASKIAYRNLTEYLNTSSDYLDSRIGSLLATADLYGQNSTIYQEVDKAWDAVGVIDRPIITDLEVYDVYGTTAKIRGSLLPRGNNVTYQFEYGTTSAFGTSSPIYNYTSTVEGILTGLQSETKYYLRLVATNENGSTFFNSQFTTTSLAPLVKIKQTVDVTETTATLHGQINPNDSFTSFYFEYGPSTALGFVTPTYPLSDATEFLNVSAAVNNLQRRQTYYYRLVATNSFGSSKSESASFFTAVKPIISSYTPITAPIDAVVTITGQNFNSMSEKNLVSFGATRASVLSSSTTELKVKVPAGASLAPISLLDAESGLTVQSAQEFVPTFTGEFKKSSLQLRVGIDDLNVHQTLVQDMDGDNKPDIIARHYPGFSVFQNVNQGGDVTIESFVRNTYTVDFSGDLWIGDFDGNGLKDVAGRYNDGLRIYPNLSVPGFIFFGVPVDLSIGSFRDLTYGDLDLDGHIDIAFSSKGNDDHTMITILRNQNPKGFISADNFVKQFSMELSYYVSELYAEDFNKDGKPELMAISLDRTFVSLQKNNSHPGAFEFEENIVQGSPIERLPRYTSQDLNQDGWRDLISYSRYQIGSVALLENKRNSTNINVANPVVVLTGYTESDIQPGDINGDGKVDLLVGTDKKTFIFLENKVGIDERLSNVSFEKFEEYGVPLSSSNNCDTKTTVNDLNGDGRPEVINVHSYNYGPHNNNFMEIWQNSPNDCLDPSLISLVVSRTTATIVLPPNTTMDQFEIEYGRSNSSYWSKANSTTLEQLSGGYSYKLRARAKCYLGFTDYHYIYFTTDCVDSNSFTIGSIGINNVSLTTYNLSSFEVQYSPAGENQWEILPQYSTQITNLLYGTTYDLRFRGRCYQLSEFRYKQFTTLCPKLSTLNITNITYNKADVSWQSNYAGDAVLEYSTDNVTWNLIDATQTMFPLVPAQKYFVRGALACTSANSDFISTSFTTPCPKVSSFSVDTVTPFSAKINWVDESNTGSYILIYSMPGGTLTTVETSSTSFDLDGLSPGARYTVTVAPQCTALKDFISTTFSTVCYAPFNLSADAITYTSAEISWNDNFSGMPYFVDYSISGSNHWITKETALTKISLSELRPGTKYEVRVHIDCITETEPYALLFFETSLYEETVFAPNPTDGDITIYPSKNLIGNGFTILDNSGRIIAHGKVQNYTIDFSYFSAGIYTLKIDGEKPMKVVKR
jgi:Zn-dependent metalloprotease